MGGIKVGIGEECNESFEQKNWSNRRRQNRREVARGSKHEEKRKRTQYIRGKVAGARVRLWWEQWSAGVRELMEMEHHQSGEATGRWKGGNDIGREEKRRNRRRSVLLYINSQSMSLSSSAVALTRDRRSAKIRDRNIWLGTAWFRREFKKAYTPV